ncbi:MAG: DNA-processing protein DprA, partial [Clostridia bacterium]|nr:DNA-processing protein DprA [Clostridia bacterium]
MQDKILWLWLMQACGHANDTFAKAYKAFSSISAIYEADAQTLKDTLGNTIAARRLSQKDLREASRTFERCRRLGITVLAYDDIAYPPSLKTISDPPAVLFVYGAGPLSLLSLPSVGVVGSREPTPYGIASTFDFAYAWAQAGLVVVSGMALGIDGVSHAAALEAGGQTVAVLGCGVDVVYPAAHRKLYGNILANGLVISEYPPGAEAKPYHFPARNRIVAALSDALAVMEGKARSGSLITASCAKKQEKTIYALPGRADDVCSQAPNLLLSEGARLLAEPAVLLTDLGIPSFGEPKASLFSLDVLEEYGVSVSKKDTKPKRNRKAAKKTVASAYTAPAYDAL